MIFSLDVRENDFDNRGVVKCPICNAKVPFSLPMHMLMAHGPNGNGKVNDELASPDEGDEPVRMPTMNRLRAASTQKGRRGNRRRVRRHSRAK